MSRNCFLVRADIRPASSISSKLCGPVTQQLPSHLLTDSHSIPNGATYREIGGEVGMYARTVQRILDRA